MNQAFDCNSRTHLAYSGDFLPTVSELESQIIVAWSELCAAVRNEGPQVQAVFVDQLHDLGVLRFQAQQRQGGAA